MKTLRSKARVAYSLSTINVITAVFMVLFHVAAIAAFWFFSWTNVIVALVLHWMAVGFGISLGYHRLHTHRGFKTSKAFEYFLAVCGTLTLEGGPIFWVATHRVHHQHSDHEGDPALAARRRLLGAHGVDPLRRLAPQQHAADGQVRARPRRGSVLSLAEHVSLGAAHDARVHAARGWRLGHGVLGHRSSRRRSACTRRGW